MHYHFQAAVWALSAVFTPSSIITLCVDGNISPLGHNKQFGLSKSWLWNLGSLYEFGVCLYMIYHYFITVSEKAAKVFLSIWEILSFFSPEGLSPPSWHFKSGSEVSSTWEKGILGQGLGESVYSPCLWNKNLHLQYPCSYRGWVIIILWRMSLALM